MNITSEVPGGNALVERVEGDDLWVRQDLRDTEGDWFWWSFGVRDAGGRQLRVHFTGSDVLAARGPAASLDGGATWSWGDALERLPGGGFVYAVPADCGEVRFAMAVPYTMPDLDRFLAGHPAVRREALCRSRKGRAVPLLRLDGPGSLRVLVTARHHCCESLASFAVEGLLEGLGGKATVTAVPFADCDGVADGDQGKNRRPHDHNRDYGIGMYPEVAAIQSLESPTVAMDLHCPWIRSPWNEHIYAIGPENTEHAAGVRQFVATLREVARGPLPVGPHAYLPFGVAWNTAADMPRSFSRWMWIRPGVKLSVCFELPYANVRPPGQELSETPVLGVPVTPDAARAFGRDLAVALLAWHQRE